MTSVSKDYYIGRQRSFIWLTAAGLAAGLAVIVAVGARGVHFGLARQRQGGPPANDRSAVASTATSERASGPIDGELQKSASISGQRARTSSAMNGEVAADARPGYRANDPNEVESEATVNANADAALFVALERLERGMADAIAKARESVVALEYTAPDAPPDTRRIATGVVINQRGETLSVRIDQPLESPARAAARSTSRIVARDFSGRRHSVHWVAADPETGLTLLRLPPRAVRPIRAATGRPNLGSQVFVVGNPFGMGHSVSRGHVAGLNRALELGARQLGGLIQIQAPLYPGDSGAAVVNLQGDWLGLIRSGLAIPGSGSASGSEAGPSVRLAGSNSPWGLAPSLAPTDISLGRPERNTDFGFAVPVQDALWVGEQLRTRGRVDRAYLGVRLEPASAGAVEAVSESDQRVEPAATAARSETPMETQPVIPATTGGSAVVADEGAILREVLSGSPASQAGLRPGDGIVELDGQPIRSAHDLTDQLDRIPAKATILLGVAREHGPRRQRLTLSVRTASRPEVPLAAGPGSPVVAVTTASRAAAESSPLLGVAANPGNGRVSPPPQPDELRLTLPRAIVERLDKLERRLEKLESFPARTTGAASDTDRQINSARNP
jgi:serine protease Do